MEKLKRSFWPPQSFLRYLETGLKNIIRKPPLNETLASPLVNSVPPRAGNLEPMLQETVLTRPVGFLATAGPSGAWGWSREPSAWGLTGSHVRLTF